jgi:predicted Ser/Thr protein kinase
MTSESLKSDVFGTTRLVRVGGSTYVERDTRTTHSAVRWLARRLAAREAAALAALTGVEHVPRLLEFDGAVVRRTFLPGVPLYEAPPRSRAFFAAALRLLRRLHCAGVAHNDLAKEANWLVAPGETCAIVDFQLATLSPARPPAGTDRSRSPAGANQRRSARFRRRAYEDLRHLLKHKRTYQPLALTARQRKVLERPTLPARVWRALVKPVYLFVTRTLLRWPERVGPLERRG